MHLNLAPGWAPWPSNYWDSVRRVLALQEEVEVSLPAHPVAFSETEPHPFEEKLKAAAAGAEPETVGGSATREAPPIFFSAHTTPSDSGASQGRSNEAGSVDRHRSSALGSPSPVKGDLLRRLDHLGRLISQQSEALALARDEVAKLSEELALLTEFRDEEAARLGAAAFVSARMAPPPLPQKTDSPPFRRSTMRKRPQEPTDASPKTTSSTESGLALGHLEGIINLPFARKP